MTKIHNLGSSRSFVSFRKLFACPPRPLSATKCLSRHDFHCSASNNGNILFNLGGLSTSRESQYFSKERGIPRTEFSPQLELIRSSEVDTQGGPGSRIQSNASNSKEPIANATGKAQNFDPEATLKEDKLFVQPSDGGSVQPSYDELHRELRLAQERDPEQSGRSKHEIYHDLLNAWMRNPDGTSKTAQEMYAQTLDHILRNEIAIRKLKLRLKRGDGVPRRRRSLLSILLTSKTSLTVLVVLAVVFMDEISEIAVDFWNYLKPAAKSSAREQRSTQKSIAVSKPHGNCTTKGGEPSTRALGLDRSGRSSEPVQGGPNSQMVPTRLEKLASNACDDQIGTTAYRQSPQSSFHTSFRTLFWAS